MRPLLAPAHAPLLGRQVDVMLAVEQHPPVQHDAALVGLHDARDAAQCHAFAAARRAQNGRGSVPGGEVGAEGEAVQLFLDTTDFFFQSHQTQNRIDLTREISLKILRPGRRDTYY